MWFISLVACLLVPVASVDLHVPLGGNSWTLRNGSSSDIIPAEVPGVVHLDLLRASRIKEPYYRYGELELRWVSTEPYWIYSRSFDADALMGFPKVLLCSEGLDSVAEVAINGHVAGRSSNMWHRHAWSVRELLKPGQNSLEIRFASPALASVANRDAYPSQVKGMWITPFQWPSCGACEGGQITPACFLDAAWPATCNRSRQSRNFLRKASAHWGWDWGAGFLTSGIYRDLSFKAFEAAIITDVVVQTFPLGPGGHGVTDSSFRLELDVFLQGAIDASAALAVKLGASGMASNASSIKVAPGQSSAHISVTVHDVPVEALWYPNGFGKPTLHELTVALTCHGHMSTWSRKVGLRRAELIEESIDGHDGLSFYFRINGAPVFVKGANWIIQDQFEPRIETSLLRRLLDGAAEANFNMLRVWGGGTFERDDFYELADERGIMLWEELKFGCSLYPRDEAFLASVRRELFDQIKRLSYHPAIVVWSGNNENQGYIGTDQELVDYSLLYDSTVQSEIRALDRSRPYWPASPSNGAEVDRPDLGVYIQRWGDSQASTYGDTHQYPQYGGPQREATDCEDMRLFSSSRFVSEYGFLAMPSFAELSQMTEPGDWSMNSTQIFFRNRQDWPRGQNLLLQQLALHFAPAASENGTERFRDSIYLTQAVQAHCVRLSSEHFRLSRSGEARTMGLLFWSLNNQWQGQSDSSIDYSGRWKLLHHAARHFFAPLGLVIHRSHSQADDFTVGLINDLAGGVSGSLALELWPWAASSPAEVWHLDASVEGFSSRNVTTMAVAKALGTHRPSDACLAATFRGAGGREASAHLQLTKLRAANLQDPRIKVAWSEQQGILAATLEAERPAPWTFLEPGMLKGHFSDNGFLLLPGRPRTITFDTAGESVTLETLKRESILRSPWHATRREQLELV